MIEQVTLDLLQLAMNIKQAEHKAAAANVANANVPGGQKTTVDFSTMLSRLDELSPSAQQSYIDSLRNNWQAEVSTHTERSSSEKIHLDQESAELLLASGKYKLLADALSRQLGLMSVAIGGGKR